ncbi:hypothetical protein AOQ84DRAFT_101792 [Glonium stellatum]|uniref:Mitotic checkpoint regulator, MAD2B-interacting-domain-containing protein n=1 Tax=Glonium stellatum TaxID=574774 RepID=A0A8E2JPW2_9PEZI|nr:hypothetical protein AOQ84DRAFT_101792 [Glonium stellatum]
MNLVAYSDSEGSDNDTLPTPKPAPKPAAKLAARPAVTSSKPAFQKVVDRTNPHKIKVNLPTASASSAAKDDIEADAPPAKKARTGGGAFSGFNALLPPPKRTAPATNNTAEGGKRGLGRGLGIGISLRTGAAPAFSREPVDVPNYGEEDSLEKTPAPSSPSLSSLQIVPKSEAQEVKLVGKPMMFKPLSVANKKKKRLAIPPPVSNTPTETAAPSPATLITDLKPPPKPKVSLFSIPKEGMGTPSSSTSRGEYQPLLYGADEESETTIQPSEEDVRNLSQNSAFTFSHPAPTTSNNSAQSLDDIAKDLNLSEADRRQLFGRQRGKRGQQDLSAINIVNFNTDKEYAHNEALRAAGETAQHNPLRSIAGTGKNSLKQLVNVATTQKDALEEHFAAGRRNKKESGSKYGW